MQNFCSSDKSQTPPTRASTAPFSSAIIPPSTPTGLQRGGAVKRPGGGGERQPTGQAKPP
eukprot:4415116-Prymnesium_polylepis.1